MSLRHLSGLLLLAQRALEAGIMQKTGVSGCLRLCAAASPAIVALMMPATGSLAAEVQSTSARGTLKEVIVTATRHSEPESKVPVAMEVLTGATLERAHVNSQEDLIQSVAGLTFNPSAAGGAQSATFMIRGQGIGFAGLPGVITYFADVPALQLPNQNTGLLSIDGLPGSFLDLENVQVLKGPQGTLFGRNSTGGAVLFVPRKPSEQRDAYLQVGYGNYDDRSIEGATNIPLVSHVLLARVAARVEKRGGFGTDVGPINSGAQYLSLNYSTARVSLLYTPTGNITSYTVGRYYHSSDGGPLWVLTLGNPAINPELVQLADQQQGLGLWRVGLATRNYSKIDYWQLINTSSWQIAPAITLKNIVSYASYSGAYGTDVDGTILPLVEQTNQFQRRPLNSVMTEELQLSGNLLDRNLTYTAGYYTDSADTQHPFVQDFRFYPFIPPAFPDPLPDTVPGIISHPGYPAMLAIGGRTASKAFYAQASLNLGLFAPALDKFKVTAGRRYTWERMYTDSYTVLSVVADAVSKSTYRNSYPSYTYNLDYQVTPNTLLYASIRDAYKTGGINAQVTSTSPVYLYRPEKLVSYETGIKTLFSIRDMQFRLDSDVFYGYYTNIQESISDPTVAPGGFVANVAKARIEGLELNLSARVLRDLTLGIVYTGMDSKYSEFTNPVAALTFAGAPFPDTPKARYTLSAEYRVPFLPGRLGAVSVRGSYSYQSKVTYGATNQVPILGQFLPGYGVFDAGLDWTGVLGDENLSLEAYGKNLANKDYVVSRFDFYAADGFITSQYGAPRTFGVQLRYDFF